MRWYGLGDDFNPLFLLLPVAFGVLRFAVKWLIELVVKWRQRTRHPSSPTSDTSERPRRKSPRRLLTQPASTNALFTPAMFARSIHCTGTVPLEDRPHPGRIASLYRELKRLFLMTRTSPKPAFAIEGWRYDPTALQEHDGMARQLGGFALSLTLQDGENRHHLVAALRTGRSREAAKRLVAIASIDDMSTPAAWVRCVTLNALAANAPQESLDDVAFLSSDPLDGEYPTVFRSKRQDVPGHAIWLIHTNADAVPPGSRWGLDPEVGRASTTLMSADERSECDHDIPEDLIDQQLFYRGVANICVLVFFGPFMALAIPVLVALAQPLSPALDRTSTDERFVEIINIAGGVWFALSVLFILSYLCFLAWESLRAYRWCRTDRPTLKPWRGGTTACQTRGTILRRGPRFGAEDWRRYWSLVRDT